MDVQGEREVHRPLQAGEAGYRVLAHSLRAQVLGGEFAEGQPLPTEVALAEKVGLSRQTVRRAFQELVAEGLVYRVRGKGTFVRLSDPRYHRYLDSVADLMDLQLDTDSELIWPLRPSADAVAASALECPPGEAETLAFLRWHRGVAFGRTVVHLPPRIAATVRGLPELSDPHVRRRYTVIGLIEMRGTDVGEADQRMTALSASPDLAADLGCQAGVPVLHVERTYFDTCGRPVEYEVSDLLPEHYTHQTRLSRRGGRRGGRRDPGPGRH